MTDKMNNLIGKVGNLKIEEANFDKWNELSPKLKLECMKWLDFKTRWNLRSTSKTEKSLADSQKFKIDNVFIDSEEKVLEITQNGVILKRKYKEYDPQFLAIFEYIFHHGILEKLKINGSEYGIFHYFSGDISAKNLEVNNPSWFKRMNDKLLKSVTFHKKVDREELDYILTIPQIKNVRSLTINGSCENVKEAEVIAQIWIENDSEIGKKLQVMAAKKRSLKKFSKHFSESIISKSKKFVRIGTDNPEKHILLEVDSLNEEHLQMTIIPASFKENDIKLIEEKEDEAEKPEDLIVVAYKLEKWNELPVEMKSECIKWLYIPYRMCLRRTSKTEKALIDSKKFEIEFAKIKLDVNAVRLVKVDIWDKGSFFGASYSSKENQVEYCEYFLEHGIFEKLEIVYNGYDQAVDLFHEPKGPYSVKNLKFTLKVQRCVENMHFWLGRMNDKLESLEIDLSPGRLFSYDNLFASPKFSNISFFKTIAIRNIDSTYKLAQFWIQKDAKIGNKYHVNVKNTGSFEAFSRYFKYRLVFKSAQFICIETNNPSKHILLQIGHSEYELLQGRQEFLQMTVIPAELKQYDNDDQWMRDWEEEISERDRLDYIKECGDYISD